MPGDEQQLHNALALAHRYLNPRERTVSEVRRHLVQKGLDRGLTDEILEILADEGYLDDARFARLFVEDKRTLEQWGTERIRRGLLARGLEAELIAAALDQGADQDGPGDAGGGDVAGGSHQAELGRALGILESRFPAPPQGRREWDRALGILIRKGYEPELALDALAAYARGD